MVMHTDLLKPNREHKTKQNNSDRENLSLNLIKVQVIHIPIESRSQMKPFYSLCSCDSDSH